MFPLYNNIYNWLDFPVFSRIRTKNCKPGLTALSLIWFLWDVKEPTPLEKSRGRRPQWCSQLSHIIHIIGWVGTVLKLINGLRAATSGRCRFTPVSTVLRKSVRFFIINILLIIIKLPKLKSGKWSGQMFSFLQFPSIRCPLNESETREREL